MLDVMVLVGNGVCRAVVGFLVIAQFIEGRYDEFSTQM